MRGHYLMHAFFETPGVITDWAQERGHQFLGTQAYKNEDFPSVQDIDYLVIMGGPQSPRDCKKYSYLQREIDLVAQMIAADKPVIGFCLGAQIIGEALGAPVEKSPEKEIGVFPISLTEAGKKDVLLQGFSDVFDVTHWHSDMPGLTPDCQILATSEGCPQQIIRYRPKVYGFQCHMEMTADAVRSVMENCPEDLSPSPFTQAPEAFLSHDFKRITDKVNVIMDRLISI